MALPKGTPRPCKGCGTTILKHKFCTNDCRNAWYSRTSKERDEARRRAQGIPPIEQVYAERRRKAERECECCSRTFLPSRGASKAAGPQRFCSKACGVWKTREVMVASLIQREAALYRRWSRAAAKRAQEVAPSPTRVCRDCGAEINHQPWITRCAECRANAAKQVRERRKATPAYRAGKSAYKARRRARLKAAMVERFDPFDVFERDKWRCHICGIKTPKRLRGTYEDNAPELDHVVPLAAGGEHSRHNTACACRKCNIEKADRPLGQLRLAA